MGQAVHGSPTTTEAVRRALQRREKSLSALARHPATDQKWRKRTTAYDRPRRPAEPRSTVLGIAREAMIGAFRRHSLLPLDDWLFCLAGNDSGSRGIRLGFG